MMTFKHPCVLLAGLLGMVVGFAGTTKADLTVVVTPDNPGSWAPLVTDSSGAQGSSNPTASVQFVTGPSGAGSLGSGSLNLITGNGSTGGDGSAQIRNSDYAGTLVTAITALSFSTYITSNNGSQTPYLQFYVAFNGHTSFDDRFIFEPPYANQGTPTLNTWQPWNALTATGGWYDSNGTNGVGPGSNSVSLATLISITSATATIVNQSPTLGGVRFTAGFVGATTITNTNLDNFTIGVSNVNTTYDFEPATAVPEPSTLIGGGMGMTLFLGYCWRKRRASA